MSSAVASMQVYFIHSYSVMVDVQPWLIMSVSAFPFHTIMESGVKVFPFDGVSTIMPDAFNLLAMPRQKYLVTGSMSISASSLL